MTSKERVIKALTHQEPDRVPVGEMGIDYTITERVLGRKTYYRAKLKERRALWEGRRNEVVESQKRDIVELVRKLGLDIVPVFLTYSSEKEYKSPKFIDENTWEEDGNIWSYSSVTDDIVCIKPKEITMRDIEAFEEPFVPHESELELIRYVVKELGDNHFIVGRDADGTFPIPGGLLNMRIDEFLVKVIEQPDFIKKLLKASSKRAVEIGKVLIKEGVDAVQVNADYCYDKGPLMSPRMFQEFVFPLLKKHCDAFHRAGVYVIKHSDGNTWALLDMIVKAGADGIHGIQPEIGMDIRKLKERYGNKLTFFGAINSDVLIRKTPEEVTKEVEYCLKYGAPGGGLVLTSSNSIQIGVKYENYMRMLEEVREKGKYPINI